MWYSTYRAVLNRPFYNLITTSKYVVEYVRTVDHVLYLHEEEGKHMLS